jgi:hypothetical protein
MGNFALNRKYILQINGIGSVYTKEQKSDCCYRGFCKTPASDRLHEA